MLSNRLLDSLEVSKQSQRVTKARTFIIKLIEDNKGIHKTDVVSLTKKKYSDLSKKAINALIVGLEIDGWIEDKIDLKDTRRSRLYILKFDIKVLYNR